MRRVQDDHVRDLRPAAAPSRLPAPQGPKPHAMPAHDCLGPDSLNCAQDIREKPAEQGEQEPIAPPDRGRSGRAPLHHRKLLAQRRILRRPRRAGRQHRSNEISNQSKPLQHRKQARRIVLAQQRPSDCLFSTGSRRFPALLNWLACSGAQGILCRQSFQYGQAYLSSLDIVAAQARTRSICTFSGGSGRFCIEPITPTAATSSVSDLNTGAASAFMPNTTSSGASS